jgi:hypothetical protein
MPALTYNQANSIVIKNDIVLNTLVYMYMHKIISSQFAVLDKNRKNTREMHIARRTALL